MEAGEIHWRPNLTDRQVTAYFDDTKYLLLCGPRKSGKSQVAAHKIVKHCVEEENGNVVIITGVASQGEGGLWALVVNMALPYWAKEIGITYSAPTTDVSNRLRIRISNAYGKTSQITLIGIKTRRDLDKLMSLEPTMVVIDEATTLEGPTEEEWFPEDGAGDSPPFFDSIVPLFRNKEARNVKNFQLIYCCNPDFRIGTRSWVYQLFYGEKLRILTYNNYVKAGIENAAEAVARYFANFKAIEIPVTSNTFLTEAERCEIIGMCAGNPDKIAAWVDGKWVCVDDGAALFPRFIRELNVVDPSIYPLFRHGEFFIGYDLGDRHQAVIFATRFIYDRKPVYLIFDEIVANEVGELIYSELVRMVVNKMAIWREALGANVEFKHITDCQLMTRTSGHTGKPEYSVLEELSGGKIEFISPRKTEGEAERRVVMANNLIYNDGLFIYDYCHNMISVFLPGNLKYKKMTGSGIRTLNKTGDYIHPFDAFTYIVSYMESTESPFTPRKKSTFVSV